MTYVRQAAILTHAFLLKGGTFKEGGAKRWKALEKDYKKHPQFVPIRRLAEENEPSKHGQDEGPSRSFIEKKAEKPHYGYGNGKETSPVHTTSLKR